MFDRDGPELSPEDIERGLDGMALILVLVRRSKEINNSQPAKLKRS
jgi:hypothetical protein